MWDVEYTDQFREWWNGLSADQQKPVAASVQLLAERGPRVFLIFDPRRTAILLIAGDKRGRWQEFYERMVPLADDLYDEHLEELHKEGIGPDA